ncbi:MAG: hypothetical protein GF317_00090 [Candidatus Lokiarchaeota archaeon]|nr:hypothetical protein [Candidatus Lokiarchaeota archaeon]MBD3198385.1 hypothetical protein [Candidatus Lokiarchaeota archaeon]
MKQKSYDEIFSAFEEITNNYNRNNQYFDILYDAISSVSIKKSNSDETISVNDNKSGVVARTYTGNWEEVALEDITKLEEIKRKIPKVSGQGNQLQNFEGWKLNELVTPKIDPQKISIDKKIQKVRDIFEYLKDYDERIINPIIGYVEMNFTRIFFNNEGCQLRQVIPKTRIFIQPIAKEGNKIDFDYLSIGGEYGFEIFDLANENMEKAAKNSLEMLEAEFPPSGNYPIILDPDMAGLIAHESFGHGLEADQILRDRSYLKSLLNKQVASEICDISDDPNVPHELGSYFFDDEGIKTQKNYLVENGILKRFIHNRETSSKMDKTPKGNGRRQSFAHPLFVRMSNTYFEPGDYDLNEMISEIDEGVILNRGYFGMEDPLGGGLQVTSKKGYLIENGEKTKLLKSVTLSGGVLELLKNIDAVEKANLVYKPGTCGKGYEDFVPVTSGGTHLRVKKALISPG